MLAFGDLDEGGEITAETDNMGERCEVVVVKAHLRCEGFEVG